MVCFQSGSHIHVFHFRQSHPTLAPLTEEEKKVIVSAIGLSKGHWFKCPMGHIYVIGECGGAMEKALVLNAEL